MKRVLIWVTLLTLLLASSAQGAELGWTWQYPRPQGNDLWSITYGSGRFVAVGDHGVILTSPDGKEWAVVSSPTQAPLRHVIYAGGRFVAVGGYADGSGTPANQVILTSTDGQNWVAATSVNGPALFGVAYGQGKFVTVGGCGLYGSRNDRAVITSADGLTWLSQPPSMDGGFCEIAFGQDRFVAVGATGRSAVFTSPDGLDWRLTATAGEGDFDGPVWHGVAFGSGKFVVAQSRGHLQTSTDGEHWTVGQVNSFDQLVEAQTGDGDRFFAAPAATLPDVISWDYTGWVPIRSAAYGAGVWVGVGTNGFMATSADGQHWQGTGPGPMPSLNALTYANGRYVAVGSKGLAITSANGDAWAVHMWEYMQMHDFMATNYTAVAFGNGRFVALDSHSSSLDTSTDGLTWHRTWKTTGSKGALLFAGGRFVAGTGTGLVTSTDGENWRQVYSPAVPWFTGLAWDGARYLAIASTPDETVLLTSSDGAAWQAEPLSTHQILSVAYGSGKYVAAGVRKGRSDPFYLLTSTDGRHWTEGSEVPFQTLRYENGLFLALSQAPGPDAAPGDLYTSADGEHWRLQPAAAPVSGAAFLNGRLITTGRAGAILFSEPVCGTFLDLPAADASCPAVTALVAQQVVSGYPDGTFQPEGQVKRAELAKMLTPALGRSPLPEGPLPFGDTDGHWAATAGYLQAVAEAGVMNGYPDGTFRPEGLITRAELVKTVLAATSAKTGVKTAANTVADPAAADYSDVSPTAWYATWVSAAEQAGLIGPHSTTGLWTDAIFGPALPATRAETARLLQAALR